MDVVKSSANLLDYWSVLVRRRWVVYLGVATVGLVALVGSFLVEPLYSASATLQIERLNPDILNVNELAKVDHNWAAYNDFYQTQYKIIASTPVARHAVERIGLVNHPSFAPRVARQGLLARLQALIPRQKSHVEPDPVEQAAVALQRRLEVSPVRNSQLVRVSWVSPAPDLAAEVANAVADAYIQFTIESQFSTTDQAREFLVNQIGTLRREITAMEDRLQEYGEAKRIISIDDTNNITLKALGDISEQRTSAQTALARAEARYRSATESSPEALPEVLESPLIARLRGEYAVYEAEYTQKSQQFKSDWPGLQTLESKLEQARRRLELETEAIANQVRASTQATYSAALKEVQNLDRLLTRHEDEAQRLKRDAVEFANLQGEAKKKRETLDRLMARQNEMALSTRLKDLDSTSTSIRVVERARAPLAPFRPRTRLNLIVGLALGLGLGIGVAFFLDYLDNTIKSPKELGKLLDAPVLAVIPGHGATPKPSTRSRRRHALVPAESIDFIAQRDGQAPSSEAYRDLRTSILLSHPGRPPGRLMVTSALPEEGKTATAINLAVVLAQAGRRVLLVDTDLRRPRLHKAFGVGLERGVSSYLSGLEQDPRSLALATGIENLDLMPSGPIPPNPSELLNSAVFAKMGEELLASYEHVLFDSPPVLSVSDAVIIASVVDFGVLVVRAGRTPNHSVRMAADKLRQSGSAPFGAVLNDLDPDTQAAGYYRYQYGRYGQSDRQEPDRPEDQQATGTRA